jgi:hypothetical protein
MDCSKNGWHQGKGALNPIDFSIFIEIINADSPLEHL